MVSSWHGTDDERFASASASATVLSWCDGPQSSQLVIALSDSAADPAARRAGVARQALAIADALGWAPLRRAALERSGQGAAPTHVSLATRTLTVDGRAVHTTRREFEILAALALNRRPMTHDALVSRIWPRVDGERGRTCLRVFAHRLRVRAGRRDIVVAERDRWTLGSDVTVDFWEWQQRLRQAGAVSPTPELRDRLTDAYHQLLITVKDAPARSEVDAELERAAHDLLRGIAAFLVEEALLAGDSGTRARDRPSGAADRPVRRDLARVDRPRPSPHRKRPRRARPPDAIRRAAPDRTRRRLSEAPFNRGITGQFKLMPLDERDYCRIRGMGFQNEASCVGCGWLKTAEISAKGT